MANETQIKVNPRKGKKRPPRSARWSKNISLGLKGNIPWNKGIKGYKLYLSPESLKLRGERISKAKKGLPHLNQRGEKSGRWKGGITSLHRYIRTSFEYRQWRSDVFTRDNFTCIWCGLKSGNGKAVVLNADHIEPYCLIIEKNKIRSYEDAKNCDALWNLNNGRTLCIDCHKKTDTFAGKIKKLVI